LDLGLDFMDFLDILIIFGVWVSHPNPTQTCAESHFFKEKSSQFTQKSSHDFDFFEKTGKSQSHDFDFFEKKQKKSKS
jgi:hypothetical protein